MKTGFLVTYGFRKGLRITEFSKDTASQLHLEAFVEM